MPRAPLLACLVGLLPACGGGGGAADAQPQPDAQLCTFVDSDGDTLTDGQEGLLDTDDDDTPDAADLDSDGDTVADAIEAGDADPCTAARDTDGDGVPDFRERDADDNGFDDGDEQPDADGDGRRDAYELDDDGDDISDDLEMGAGLPPFDTDRDGTPDYHDDDSDDDGVPDRYEGTDDTLDGDGVPAFRDDDADGDGIPDRVEAGVSPETPPDSDADGAFDFIDRDSDNDGLPDEQEDRDGDGAVDAGESSPRDADSDDDGWPDAVEWAAGSDPLDDASGLGPDDLYFVLPLYDPEKVELLVFTPRVRQADVLFQVDTTSSMGTTVATLRAKMQSDIAPSLAAEIPDVAMGVSWFKDFPLSPFGTASDQPFRLAQRMTTVLDDVLAGLDVLEASGGNDDPEAGVEALYQALTGEGIAWTVGIPGEVPKFQAGVGYDPARGHGLLGGPGFRDRSLPIIIHATDALSHDAAEYRAAGIDEAHALAQVRAAAGAIGAKIIGLAGPDARPALEGLARDTGTVVPPTAWGPVETRCHTGLGGSLRDPDPDGMCPLVFELGTGDSVDAQVTAGVKALINHGALDVSGEPAGDPLSLPTVDTARFITLVEPVPPLPAGARIDGTVIRGVPPDSTVTFRVHARNTLVDHTTSAQLFRVTIRLLDSDATVLSERRVFVIVPAGAIDL